MPHIHELYDFTASAYILHPSEHKVLLIHHKKLNGWIPPGGHIELNEEPEQTLWRELYEETGLRKEDLSFVNNQARPFIRKAKLLHKPDHLVVYDYDSVHKHIDLLYILRSKTSKITNENAASHSIRWFSLEEVISLHKSGKTFDNVLDFCQDILG
jgi:8-oxo-dGTP pyrophosphatase MutT (NUDIX family)